MILYGTPGKGGYTPGGKAEGLYRLRRAGVPVPDFLVIPAETFDAALARPSAGEPSAPRRREKLLAFSLPAPDRQEIVRILTAWNFPGRPVVVRSSVAGEDGQQDAFPGTMDTFLNLTTPEALWTAVARCAASAYSERAVIYRQQKGLTMDARPAVIIQQQVAPVASGVLFTTFPEYPQEMAIHATFGFGEGLVGGQLEADEFYYWKRTGQLHRRNIAAKETQFVATGGDGTGAVPLDPAQREQPALTGAQLEKLFALGSRLESEFGRPQDIEFVVSGEDVWLVQARPVTQPIPEVVVYDNSNIQESYCGVTTPLTFSFARRAYATVYRQTMRTLGLPAATIRAQEGVVTALLGLVKGRIYYHINNWYRGLQLLPSFRQNKADMERMMGLEEPVDFVEDRQKTALQKLRMLPGLLVNLTRLLWGFRGLRTRVPAFHAHFGGHYRRFYALDLAALDTRELLRQKELLDQELLQAWTTPIINDFYVMMTNGQVARKLRQSGVADHNEFLSRYLSGDKQIESAQPTRAIQRLAALAYRQPDLRALILSLPGDLHAQVQARFPDFYGEVQQFIGQYGDRTVGELKLETRTMRVTPLVFYKYLRNYLAADAAPPVPTESNTRLHEEAAAELTGRLAGRPARFRRGVRGSLGRLQQAIRYRESLRLERTRLFGMYRALYRALGERLAAAGALHDPEDVFYLSEEEISRAVAQPGAANWPGTVADRKAEFAGYAREEVPARVVVPYPPVDEVAPADPRPGFLRGTGCFRGVVTGEVVVITDPGSDLDVTGKIICALRTDPGWAALFPTSLGVLIEKGSSLSHSVILLRELALPTIINVPRLTHTLQSGQRVRMDGATGEITIIQDAHA